MLNKLTYLIYPLVIQWLQALDDGNLYNDQNEHIIVVEFNYIIVLVIIPYFTG